MSDELAIPQMRAYEERLGLSWDVCYILAPQEQTCRIITDPVARRHTVAVNPTVARNIERGLADLAHELCHGKLSEVIDPTFGTLYFSRSLGKLKGARQREFEYRAQLLYLAWLPVEIWVNDLRHGLWPELTLSDCESFERAVRGLLARGLEQTFVQPIQINALIQHWAEVQRHQLPPSTVKERVMALFDFTAQSVLNALVRHLLELPALSMTMRDLDLMKRAIADQIRLRNLPISPRLVQEDDRWVWLV